MNEAELQAEIGRLESEKRALEAHKLGLLERRCASHPRDGDPQPRLLQLEQLLDLRQALQLELALLTPDAGDYAPAPVFCEQEPDRVVASTEMEYGLWLQDSKQKPLPWYVLVLALGALAGLIQPYWSVKLAAVAVLLAAIVIFCSALAHKKRAAATVKALQERYAPLPPDQWVEAAREYARIETELRAARAAALPEQEQLRSRLEALDRDIRALTGDRPVQEYLRELRRRIWEQSELARSRRESKRSISLPPPGDYTMPLEQTQQRLEDLNARLRVLRSQLPDS